MKISFLILLCTGLNLLQAQDQSVSTWRDTKKSSLTIYNSGFGVVREQRAISLNKGLNTLRYEDVASRIDPTSLSIKSLTQADALSVREQNYQYDLLTPNSILSKSVGKKIRFRQQSPGANTQIIEGTLLNPPDPGAYGTNGLVVKTNDGKVLLNPVGEAILDEIPDGLVSRPSLLWKLNSTRAGEHQVEVNYISEGMEWKADYVSVINESDTKLDLTGWVTLDNKSGATYSEAQLQLIAGDVKRVQEQTRTMDLAKAPMLMSEGKSFDEESFFEYHLYTLDGTTTVRNNEIKQMQLLKANDASVQKKLVFDASRVSWTNTRSPGSGSSTNEIKAAIIVQLKNEKANNMGMALPKGKVRVYKADSRGNVQFIGEDLIDHTPSNEVIRLHIGEAFDVVGTRTQSDTKRISDRAYEYTFEIQIRNRKETPVEVSVVEHSWGDWEIVRNSDRFVKVDASTFEFPLTLKKDESKTVRYTIRQSW